MMTFLYLLAAVWAIVLASWWIRAALHADCDEAGAVADWVDYEEALGGDG